MTPGRLRVGMLTYNYSVGGVSDSFNRPVGMSDVSDFRGQGRDIDVVRHVFQFAGLFQRL